MKIAVDAFGGDNAPVEILKGAAQAVAEYGVEIILTGNADIINAAAEKHGISKNGMTVSDCSGIIGMEDEPTVILKAKRNSSMGRALDILAQGHADAAVSAGSTGALLAGGSLIVKRLPGIKRAALAPIIPTASGPAILIDCGANVENKPEYLMQFGIMGSVYMEKIIGIEKPRVGLLNNGTEPTKGTPLHVEAHGLLISTHSINFIGNIEAREVPLGGADVIVADGFSGNILLKSIEGMGAMMLKSVKRIFYKNLFTKLAAKIIQKDFMAFKQQMDYTEYGGAPLMGISKPVIKAHGSSDANAIKNAIRQAISFVEKDVNGYIAEIINE